MRLLGCLFIVVLFAAEVVAVWLLAQAWPGELFGTLVALIVLSIFGVKLVGWRKARLPEAMLRGDYSALVAVFGAALIALPGFLSGALGIVLQVPAIRRRFAGAAGKIAGGLAKKAMQKGFAGGGGFPGGGGFAGGGFGGFPGGGFPGGGFQPRGELKPDQSVQSAKPKKMRRKAETKTIETTARREGRQDDQAP